MERLLRRERELSETNEQQKEQLSRYEKKLRDVIQAYKGILKEKEALEASLNALNETRSYNHEPADTEQSKEVPLKTNVEGAEDEPAESSIQDIVPDKAPVKTDAQIRDKVEHLGAKVATLSASLSTITAEKSRIETNFQRDRKKLLHEKEELERSLAAACSQADSTAEVLKHQLSEVKAQLVTERTERSREVATNQVVLRELQRSLTEEKQKREALETEMLTKTSKMNQLALSSVQLETAERKLKDLSNELESTKMKLRSAEEKLQQPSPLLVQLQNEMADVKVQHRLAIQQEQRHAAEAEEAVRQLAAAHEKRVDELEASLALLSESIGSYDRLRQQDLAQVGKLKEQLALLQDGTGRSSNVEVEEYDADKLLDKMRALKDRLLDLSARSNEKIDVTALLQLRGLSDGPDADHEACNAELERLRQQLEWYQRQREERTPSLANDREAELSRLRVQVQFLTSELEHCERRSSESLAAMQGSMATERTSWKDEMVQLERSFRGRLADLDLEMQKQRDRSLALLQEKDEELDALKQLLQPKSSGAAVEALTSADTSKKTGGGAAESDWPEGLADLASMTLGATASGGQILHYHEDLARKTLEIDGLRRTKNRLESTLRDLQMATVAIDMRAAEERHRLRDEIDRLERNRSRESANLEYLKNVLLELFLRPDPSTQSHMFNAIATVLHFSPREVQRVRQQHPKWKSV